MNLDLDRLFEILEIARLEPGVAVDQGKPRKFPTDVRADPLSSCRVGVVFPPPLGRARAASLVFDVELGAAVTLKRGVDLALDHVRLRTRLGQGNELRVPLVD